MKLKNFPSQSVMNRGENFKARILLMLNEFIDLSPAVVVVTIAYDLPGATFFYHLSSNGGSSRWCEMTRANRIFLKMLVYESSSYASASDVRISNWYTNEVVHRVELDSHWLLYIVKGRDRHNQLHLVQVMPPISEAKCNRFEFMSFLLTASTSLRWKFRSRI